MTLAETAIARLREFQPPEGYYLAFSGGKDSVVLKDLAIKSGVKFDAHYNVTTIDPPELVRFIRKHHPEIEWRHQSRPFLRLLEVRGFPSRKGRWCCEEYKEGGGSGRVVLTGIRAAESARRGKRRMVENCMRDPSKRYVHPIIDWSEEDVWRYIRSNNIPYCELYDQGWKRIGCIFCPMATPKNRYRDFHRYPRYVSAFLKSFQILYAKRKANGNTAIDRWEDGDSMFEYYLGDGRDERGQQFMHFDSDEEDA